MQKTIIFFSFVFGSVSLFSQTKHTIDIKFPKLRALSQLHSVQNLGEKGTLYVESRISDFKASGLTFTYLSLDGKVFWKTDLVKMNYIAPVVAIARNNDMLLYQTNGVKPLHVAVSGRGSGKLNSSESNKNPFFFCRLDYTGKTIESGESGVEYPLLCLYESDDKLWALMQSTEEKTNTVAVWLQELDKKTLKPMGKPQKTEVPEATKGAELSHRMQSVKGFINNYWVLVGRDSENLVFYGKKVNLEQGKVNFQIVITDLKGKKKHDFATDIQLDNKRFINRTPNNSAHISYAEFYKEYYTTATSMSPNPISGINQLRGGQFIDAGTLGECAVDMQNKAIYFFGNTGAEPDNSKVDVNGCFVQKFNFAGQKLWSREERYTPKNDKDLPTVPNVLYLNPAHKGLMFYSFPDVRLALDTEGGVLPKVSAHLASVQSKFDGRGQTILGERTDLYGFYHCEIAKTALLSQLFESKAAEALQKNLETNGHSDSWYLIQSHKNSFTVFESDPLAKKYMAWVVPTH
jgi:hypothetical protein